MTPRPSIAALYRDANARTAPELAERRKLVSAHEDLARRLTLPPLRFSRPESWSGFIPPLMVEGPTWKGRDTWIRSPSPQRVHLVAIVREAYARTWGEHVAAEWLEEINTDRWSGPWTPHTTVEGT